MRRAVLLKIGENNSERKSRNQKQKPQNRNKPNKKQYYKQQIRNKKQEITTWFFFQHPAFFFSFFSSVSLSLLQFSASDGLSLLLLDGLLDSLALGEGDQGLGLADDKDVAEAGGESVSLGILDGDDVEGSLVALDSDESSHAARVAPAGEHHQGPGLELEDVGHLSGGDVDLDDVVDLGVGGGVADGAAVVGHKGGDPVGGHGNLVHAAKLVAGLRGVHAVEHEASLGVVHEPEGVVALLHGHHVHKPGGEVVVRSHLAVHLHVALHADLHALLVGEGVFQAVSEDDAEGQALALLVGAGAGLGGPDALHLSQHPVVGRIQALHVLLRSARHF